MDIVKAVYVAPFSSMIEPTTPITIRIAHSSYPAFLLPNDDNAKFKPTSAFIRYRHLRQYQRVIRSSALTSVLSGSGQSKITPGIIVGNGASLLVEPLKSSSAIRPSPLITEVVTSKPQPPTSRSPDKVVLGHSEVKAGSSSRPAVLQAYPEKATHVANGTPLDPATAGASQRGEGDSTDASTTLVDHDGTSNVVVRHEHAIRSHHEKIVWFASTGDYPLSEPLAVPAPRYADLYVHAVTEGSLQVWLRSNAGVWCSVDMFHPHPYLRGHVLHILPSREPRWVTKDTVRTYKARAKKRVRETSILSEGAESV